MRTLLIWLALSFSANAKLLHIIHTNDLHSYFKGYLDGRGGYARVVTKIRELKAQSRARGIPVLQLDAGDWGEGTSFFISDNGQATIKSLEMMGVEIAAIGNHDQMLGTNILSDQIRRANVKTKFVSANMVPTPELVSPYVDLEKNGIKIRVIGLTTSEIHYQYQVKPGKVLPPIEVGKAQGIRARNDGRELIIALTHIGVEMDENLAMVAPELDLIVGGHSHTKLEKPVYSINRSGVKVPVVQAWAHGLVVGSLLIDVRGPGNGVRVIDYRLHKVDEDVSEDAQMKTLVEVAAQNRNQYFGNRFDEVIGETKVPMSGYEDGHAVLKASCWGEHMARMGREVTGADVGIHLATFAGVHKPPGPVTYGDIIDNFPHIRKLGDPGWELATVLIRGVYLKPIMKAVYALRNSLGVNFSGIYYKSEDEFFIGGKSINDKAFYSLGFPAEVGHALKKTLPNVTARVFPSLENTGKFYWPSMEAYIRTHSPISCAD